MEKNNEESANKVGQVIEEKIVLQEEMVKLGEYSILEIRTLAKDFWPIRQYSDEMGICFKALITLERHDNQYEIISRPLDKEYFLDLEDYCLIWVIRPMKQSFEAIFRIRAAHLLGIYDKPIRKTIACEASSLCKRIKFFTLKNENIFSLA